MIDTTNLNLLWTSLIVEELIRHGCSYFCLSPGSRSAPLAVAIARNPGTQAIICYDERAAAFHALGWARATGRPAVLVCTSGSAMTHYFPAIVEASQDGVPMLILSSDRPPELIDVGANQAIRQDDLYGDYVRWHFNFPTPTTEIPPQWVLTTIDQAYKRCLEPEAGPVHLNLPFREPLAPTEQKIDENYLTRLNAWKQGSSPFTIERVEGKVSPLFGYVADSLENGVESATKGLLIIGRLQNRCMWALELANKLRWPVFADVLSGLRFDAGLETQIPYYDQLLSSEKFAAQCKFDTVLHLGGNFVSGRLLKHLAAHPPQTYLHCYETYERLDPNHQVTQRFNTSMKQVHDVLHGSFTDAPWLSEFQAFSSHAETVFKALDQEQTLSEPGVARLLARILPSGHALLAGNSLPVRELDGFAAPRERALAIYGNRGTSGIDGHVATAAGIAVGRKGPVTLLCGDLTLFHDLNSLHLLSRIDQPVTIVVINNSGGGIFSFLPIHEHEDVFEPWFGTPHTLSFTHAAAMFGMPYHAPSTRSELETALQTSWQHGHSALIEVVTDRNETLALHRKLQSALQNQEGCS